MPVCAAALWCPELCLMVACAVERKRLTATNCWTEFDAIKREHGATRRHGRVLVDRDEGILAHEIDVAAAQVRDTHIHLGRCARLCRYRRRVRCLTVQRDGVEANT